MRKINNKANELWYRLSSSDYLQKEVSKFHRKYKIAPDYFKKYEDLEKFRHSHNIEISAVIWDILMTINPLLSPRSNKVLKKVDASNYIISKETNFFYEALENYILGGEELVQYYLRTQGVSFGVTYVNNFSKKNFKYIDKINRNGVFLYVRPYATKSDLMNFIKYGWYELSKDLKKKNKFKFKRIRQTKYTLIGLRVYELMKAKREKLLLKKGEYRELKVASLIKNEFPNTKIGSDTIKKIYTQQRRLREG